MKFIVRHKEEHWLELKKQVIRFLEENGAEWTEKIWKADFALSIGGDGTLMRDHYKLRCPVLGINPGSSIGYYLRADKDNYQNRLLSLIHGKEGKDYFIYGLMRLESSVNSRKMDALALNDVLISPVYVRRMLETKLKTSSGTSLERNSGIIVYTPTGSHAFAHSAGAEKIHYSSNALGVTALAPYSGTLKKREINSEKESVSIECLNDVAEICIDGSETNILGISKGDVVEVRKSADPLRLVGFSRKFS
ncbi:MAG: NAD(+)/NADH kinase [Candidatus Aenigmarchaeota archaeon]|nr:NAD(+)/NADH kinase [Candidatus Aenigmarchaeota archaeon]